MITPKVIAGKHAGQRYTCTYDPVTKAWVWQVAYVRVYPRFGSCASSAGAASHARRFINKMNKLMIAEEERE